MSVFDEINKIPTQTLSSDLPNTLTGTVLAAKKDTKKGEYAGAPILKLEVLVFAMLLHSWLLLGFFGLL